MFQPTPRIPHPETVPDFDPAVAFGTANHELQWVLRSQLIRSLWVTPRDPCNADLPAALAALMDLKPQNPLEAQHAILVIAAFNASMECIQQAKAFSQSLEGLETGLRLTAKMMTTYQNLVDGFYRSRGKGMQNFNIEELNVQSGAQAIVGPVEVKPRRKRNKADTSAPMPIEAKPVQTLDLGPSVPLAPEDARLKRRPGA